jgi:hypothetical protein
MTKYQKLTDEDLRKNKYKYGEHQIIYSIINDPISLRVLVKTQNLTPYIAAKFVVFGGTDEQYGDCTEDCWIDDNDIIRLQPHITQEHLFEAHEFVMKEEANELKELNSMGKYDKVCKLYNNKQLNNK